jgi:hypothetical protein
MPLFVAALLGGLINIAATLAGRVLLALGFAAVTYTGVSTSLAWLKQQALQSIDNMPLQLLAMLSYMKVGQCISILFSAVAARLLLQGLTSDTVRRLVMK